MIFVSSSCVKADKIKDAVLRLAQNGFNNIELSGGTNYYSGFEDDLVQLKEEYNLNYLIHNYFPPPQEHFVLNLASVNEEILSNTLQHCKRAINLSEKLGIVKYGVHAGFLIDPRVNELGKRISSHALTNRDEAITIFCKAYSELKEYSKTVKIYIENNVVSQKNFQSFGLNPFLLTDYDSYIELKQYFNFNLLLDLAHLKVSCNTLGLDFHSQSIKLSAVSDYIHISDNEGKEDSNFGLRDNSDILSALLIGHSVETDYTLEVYDDLQIIEKSIKILNAVLKT